MYAVSQARILRDIDEEIRIAEISNHILVIIEATVITGKYTFLGSSFWNNSYLERAVMLAKLGLGTLWKLSPKNPMAQLIRRL